MLALLCQVALTICKIGLSQPNRATSLTKSPKEAYHLVFSSILTIIQTRIIRKISELVSSTLAIPQIRNIKTESHKTKIRRYRATGLVLIV